MISFRKINYYNCCPVYIPPPHGKQAQSEQKKTFFAEFKRIRINPVFMKRVLLNMFQLHILNNNNLWNISSYLGGKKLNTDLFQKVLRYDFKKAMYYIQLKLNSYFICNDIQILNTIHFKNKLKQGFKGQEYIDPYTKFYLSQRSCR